ncbi:Predicted metal-dependent hydrolase, TIM-barrel fold [Nocardioides alpinus]|uniref:Predicted metal-dependent hydrolase, TIM-barrel fold n=2 Tax=Nocardioides alpinus TaxID=748909 RepID=A0A1I0YB64_9ACTN|nr:amidohydrolase family protein [Nocardioides alpinus]SFB09740.1 Predicted metal-dependent hydrolase, TIM-barrel fold [Nocardioides alpinus]
MPTSRPHAGAGSADPAPVHTPRLNRRRLLQGSAGVTLAGASPVALTDNASASAPSRTSLRRIPKIDVHAHFLPTDYRQALIDNGHSAPDGFPVLPTWSAPAHLSMMDSLGIGTSMLSISSPGVDFGADKVEWARRVNDTGAKTVQDNPGRFGLFASLPLPDVDASLAEIRYAFDTLKVDGVSMETNYDGIYLGDSRLDPVFAELDRRGAVLFLHPTSPSCWEATSLGYPRPMLEFLLDTTRAVSNMVLNGTLARYPHIRLIVPHAGAALPVLADRLAGVAGLFPVGGQPKGEVDVIATLRRLHYEVGAGWPFPRHIAALLNLVDASQLVFGSDFPFGGAPGIAANINSLIDTDLMQHKEVAGVLRENALQLFPRLQAVP